MKTPKICRWLSPFVLLVVALWYATPPTNPYDHQSRPAHKLEADVRSSTEWMGKMLTEAQYESYLGHYLAENEMIRFQNR